MKRIVLLIFALILLGHAPAWSVDGLAPEVLRISPTSGPEGTRVEIIGRNLRGAAKVLFGRAEADFKVVSDDRLIAIVPHRQESSKLTLVTPTGRAESPFAFVVVNDPRVPEEVSYKAGYVNTIPMPAGFSAVLLWGIAIADTREAGYERATVEVKRTQLSCRVDGHEVILNDGAGEVRGGLYRRNPWFGTDAHEPMPLTYDVSNRAVILRVGQRPDKVWHFWSVSPRAALPAGKREGCTVKAWVKIAPGALLQMGMDYWKNPTIGYENGGNNHEAGASNWYFPSDRWQEAAFSDIGGPKF